MTALLAEHELTNDYELIKRLQAGDEDVCREYVRRFYPPLRAFLLGRLGGRASEAEPLACDVLTRGLQKLTTYRAEGSLLHWLLIIARNEANRQHARNRQTVFSDLPEHALQRVEDFLSGREEPQPLDGDQLTVVHEVLSELSESYFEVLHGKYFENLSVVEIAGRTQRTAKAVENLLRRARAEFRGIFERKLRQRRAGTV